MSTTFDAIVTGIGGQGNVLASRLIAYAYMERGLAVRTAETIGMSQRGGTVMSHVRVGATLYDIPTSLISTGGADLILAFEPAEALRVIDHLSPTGLLITAIQPQRPVTSSLARETYDGEVHREYLAELLGEKYVELDGEVLTDFLGNPRVLNVVLLGAAIGNGDLDLTRDEMRAAISARVKPQFVELNHRALDLGIANCRGGVCVLPED